MSNQKIILALVDDHPIVLEGLKSLFKNYEDRFECLLFSDGQSVVTYLEKSTIDVILLDIALPDMNGIDVCRVIKTQYPEIVIIGLSNQSEQSTILQMLQNGASGFLLKSAAAEEIVEGINDARCGEVVLSSEVKKIITTPTNASHRLPSLTKREKQILQLLAQGKTTTVIAEEILLSKFTIDTYRKNLLQKFEVKNTTELLMLLVENKLM